MSSSVIDLAIRIKNGYMSGKESIIGRYSNLNVKVVEILKKEGYLKEFEISKDGPRQFLTLKLLYDNAVPAVQNVQIFSKPGKRIYNRAKYIKPVMEGAGLEILSTPKGLLTGSEAKKQRVGGEVLFRIW